MVMVMTDTPDVLKIARVGEPFAKVTDDTFDVHVLLSEEPHGGLVAALVNVGDNATVSSVLKLASPSRNDDEHGRCRSHWP